MAMQEAAFPAAVAPKQSSTGLFIMTALLLGFGFWVIYPIVLTLVMSFNAAPLGQDPVWTLSNWSNAWSDPGALASLWNTVVIYLFNTVIGFPIAIMVSWALARTKVAFSRGLEFMFWVSFMLPTISTTVGWTFLLDPDSGLLNVGLSYLGIGALNIYSVPGIVFAHLMSSQISQGVMLLTPAFRNMDSALEEAGRLSGAT